MVLFQTNLVRRHAGRQCPSRSSRLSGDCVFRRKKPLFDASKGDVLSVRGKAFCGARPARACWRAERLYTALWAREKGGKTSGSRALGGQAEALGGDRTPIRVHLLDTSRGVAETDPAVRTVTTQ